MRYFSRLRATPARNANEERAWRPRLRFELVCDASNLVGSGMRRLGTLPRRLHHNERGTISILSVFAVLLLTMLLGMVMNVGRDVDGKIRMQNAADSAAYSGGVVLARGMNTLAFTNHMLCDVFAMTAFLREARDQNSRLKSIGPGTNPDELTGILKAWEKPGETLAAAKLKDPQVRGFAALRQKLPAAGSEILRKIPYEQRLVVTYSEWGASASEQLLPLMEDILRYEMIPEYQRAVVATIPDIAQRAALEIARRHGEPERGRGPMLAVLWRTSGVAVAGGGGMFDRTMPVVDPEFEPGAGGVYLERARSKREKRARRYLNQLNSQAMWVFDHPAQMSQFNGLWRTYTCGNMMRLLNDEYPYTNLPHLIRTEEWEITDPTDHLDADFTFIAVVYARQVPQMMPKVFVHPVEGDATAFAAVRLFIPWRRLRFWSHTETSTSPTTPFDPGSSPDSGATVWTVGRQQWRTITTRDPMIPFLVDDRNSWDLFNQSWAAQLVPATHPNIAMILQTPPPEPELRDIELPSLGGLGPNEINRINTH